MKFRYFSRFLGYFLLYLTATNLIAQTAVLGDNFGYTQGSFGVSDGGAATYYIPFVLPAELQSRIRLSYNSQGGNSFVGLGQEMTAKLLEKVEELTRYVIELKKENEDIKQENQTIKKMLQNRHK